MSLYFAEFIKEPFRDNFVVHVLYVAISTVMSLYSNEPLRRGIYINEPVRCGFCCCVSFCIVHVSVAEQWAWTWDISQPSRVQVFVAWSPCGSFVCVVRWNDVSLSHLKYHFSHRMYRVVSFWVVYVCCAVIWYFVVISHIVCVCLSVMRINRRNVIEGCDFDLSESDFGMCVRIWCLNLEDHDLWIIQECNTGCCQECNIAMCQKCNIWSRQKFIIWICQECVFWIHHRCEYLNSLKTWFWKLSFCLEVEISLFDLAVWQSLILSLIWSDSLRFPQHERRQRGDRIGV